MSRNENLKPAAARWWSVPMFFAGVGLVCVVTAAVGGHLVLGLAILAATVVFGAALLILGHRSATYREESEHPDERTTAISRGAWAGTVHAN
jgi:hypothetical protein